MKQADSQAKFGPSVFLAYSKTDKEVVREFNDLLRLDGFQPWFDETCLVAGQDWQLEIAAAVRGTDAFAVFLSKRTVDSRGYIHKELALALDVAEREPEASIFIIPICLDEVLVPSRLNHLHWIKYGDPAGGIGLTYLHLQRALIVRANQLRRSSVPLSTVPPITWGIGKAFVINDLINGLVRPNRPIVMWEGGSYLVHGRNPSGEPYTGTASLTIQENSASMEVKVGRHFFKYSGQYYGELLALSGTHLVTYDTRSQGGVLHGSWGEGGFEELIPASPFAKVGHTKEEAPNTGPQPDGTAGAAPRG